MLKRYLPFLVLVVIAFACNKDKLETRPSIKIKNINSTEVLPSEVLNITIEFADNEGDLGEGMLTYYRNRVNLRPIQNPGSNDKADVDSLRIPSFPKTQRGDFELKIPGEFLNEDPDQQDSMYFKIVARDVAGNVSDTIQTPLIINVQQ